MCELRAVGNQGEVLQPGKGQVPKPWGRVTFSPLRSWTASVELTGDMEVRGRLRGGHGKAAESTKGDP